MEDKILFTSESVGEGHPDKLCDEVADAILDECVRQDPKSRVAIECFAPNVTRFIIGGEVTTTAKIDYQKIARTVFKKVGYDSKELGFDGPNADIEIYVKEQSPDIAQGVDKACDKEELGAGDQGIMFGYATDETSNYMPLALDIANDLLRQATKLRHERNLDWERPDMKSQVTIDYTKNTPSINTILMSIQHNSKISHDRIVKEVRNNIINPILNKYKDKYDIDVDNMTILINPTGKFVIGGPAGDTGLTGRKIVVDSYGGACPIGGGAFSGKDATKVDRSASYLARYIAKNIVAAGLCRKALVELSYAIGMAEPVSISLNTYGTSIVNERQILDALINGHIFEYTPSSIIKNFSMRNPIGWRYQDLAVYGHFGRIDIDTPWEHTDKTNQLLKYVRLKAED